MKCRNSFKSTAVEFDSVAVDIHTFRFDLHGGVSLPASRVASAALRLPKGHKGCAKL
jgi:hypothetical protein